MIRYAKNNEKLYADMRSLYEDSDFPTGWYSPARNTDADARTLRRTARSSTTISKS